MVKNVTFNVEKNASVFVMHDAYSSDDIESDFQIRRRDTIRLTDHERILKKWRLAVYNFLDHPRSAVNFPYHFGIFILVLISVIVGAIKDAEHGSDDFVNSVAHYLERILAVFFLFEFALRLWSVSADARYQGLTGRLHYLTRPVCLVDVLIISVTFAMLFINRSENKAFVDILRFVQILRLFHIDRQMTTWGMVKKMTVRSSFELVAAYYISSLIFMGLAFAVYEIEVMNDENEEKVHRASNQTEPYSHTFDNYGDAMWFSIISFLTVGYGDIVPKHWLSKVVTCLFAYAAYCTFVAASTLVSVGMTLMIENENKDKQKGKIKTAAARLIQHWYRYHLATDRPDKWKEIPYFKHICYKMHLADERIMRSRALAKKIREKYIDKQKKAELAAQANIDKLKKNALHHAISESSWQSKLVKPLNFKNTALRKVSIGTHSGSAPEDISSSTNRRHSMSPKIHGVSPLATPSPNSLSHDEHAKIPLRRMSSSTISSSFDLSDVEKEIEINNILETQSMDSKRASCDINAIDESVLVKYRPLIRFFNYLLFQLYIKKFKRMRKPYQLMDAEAELVEMELSRMHQFHDLELRLEAVIGKHTVSPFADHQEGMKQSIEKRLDLCEKQIEETDSKLDEIIRLTEQIALQMGPKNVRLRRPLKTSMLLLENLPMIPLLAP